MNSTTASLEDIAKISSGDGAPQDSKSFSDSGIPFIRAGSLVKLLNGSNESNLEKISDEVIGKRRMRIYPKDTVVFAKSGMSCTKGHVYQLRQSSCVVNHLAAIECGPKINPNFLLRWFQLNSPSRLIANAAYPSIKISDIRALKIPLPPLEEQKRIAAILDAADDLRRKRKQTLEELDNLLQSAFLDLFGDPVENPMGWPRRALEEIVSETKLGLVRSAKEFGWDYPVPYVRMDAVTNTGKFLPEKVQRTDASDDEIAAYSLRKGDFLFNTRNSKELVGKVCVFPGPDGWLYNNNLMRIRFKKGIDPYVIATQFSFNPVKRELEQRKSGTTNVFAVYWKSLKSLPVVVPDAELQLNFAKVVGKIEAQKALMRKQLIEFDDLFASLQQRAFNGEL